MAGNGVAQLSDLFSDAVDIKGTLKMKLSATQAPFWIGWALQNIDAARALPFATTDPDGVMPVGDLATLSLYYAVQAFDGTMTRRRLGGCRCSSFSLECTAEKPRQWVATYEIEAAKIYGNANFGGTDTDPDATEFPAPTFADLPNDIYLFSHASLVLGGVARPLCNSHALKSANKLDPQRYGSKWIQTAQYLGRDTQLESKLLYKTNPGDRTKFESLASQAASLVLNNGTKSVTFNLNGKNYVSGLKDDTSREKSYSQTLTIRNALDNTAGAGLSVSFT